MTSRSDWLALVIAGALVAPASLPAQEQGPPRSHVVRRGETLWRIAQDSLGNGHRWREILTLNGLRAAEALEVGSTIRLPERAPARRPVTPPPPTASSSGVVRAAPAVATPAAVAPPGAPAPARPATPPSAAPSKPAPVPAAPPPRDARDRTVFFDPEAGKGRASSDSSGVTSAARAVVPPAVFESVSAPFVAEGGLLEGAGRCVALGDSSASRGGGVMLHGRVSLAAPRGTAAADSRWLLVRRGPVLPGLGPVAIPTGVARVTSPGTPATAEVLAQFDAMTCDDLVLPVDLPSVAGAKAVPVAGGAEGRVAWVANEALLPTLQHALIVDLGGRVVQAGDVVTVYAASGESIATARVVRTGSRSATALVMRQSSGALAAGQRVRVTEKLP